MAYEVHYFTATGRERVIMIEAKNADTACDIAITELQIDFCQIIDAIPV